MRSRPLSHYPSRRRHAIREFHRLLEEAPPGWLRRASAALTAGREDDVFEALYATLNRVFDGAVLEISPLDSQEGDVFEGEVVVSANGDVASFPAVFTVVESAAAVLTERYRLTALRPALPEAEQFVYRNSDGDVAFTDIFYTVRDDGRHLALRLFIPGFQSHAGVNSLNDPGNMSLYGAAVSALDALLGEFTSATVLTFESVASRDVAPGDAKPLPFLRDDVDAFLRKSEKKAVAPSSAVAASAVNLIPGPDGRLLFATTTCDLSGTTVDMVRGTVYSILVNVLRQQPHLLPPEPRVYYVPHAQDLAREVEVTQSRFTGEAPERARDGQFIVALLPVSPDGADNLLAHAVDTTFCRVAAGAGSAVTGEMTSEDDPTAVPVVHIQMWHRGVTEEGDEGSEVVFTGTAVLLDAAPSAAAAETARHVVETTIRDGVAD